MKRILNWLDENRNIWALSALLMGVYVIGQAAVRQRWLIAGWPRPTLIAGIFGIAFGFCVLSKKPNWARWLGAFWLTFWTIGQAISASLSGWTISDGVAAGVMAIMAVGYYFAFFRTTQSNEDKADKKPFLSLVLLVREPRFLDSTVLASLASRAWNIEISGSSNADDSNDREAGSGDDDSSSESYVVGSPPIFLAKHPSAMCLIHDFARPYFDEPEKVAESVPELRLRNAILQHQGWIAVDVLDWYGPGEPLESSYCLIARLLAELADENVLAVIDPDAGRIFPYDPATEEKLKSDNPLQALREPYYVPVITISPDDPEMKAAVAQARERWPEFVAAFEKRLPDSDNHYAVKAPLGTADSAEFMWMEVTGIENDVIYGLLGNDPANIPELKEGDRVRTTVGELNDWMYVVDGKPSGGFTIEVVAKRANPPHSSNDHPNGIQ